MAFAFPARMSAHQRASPQQGKSEMAWLTIDDDGRYRIAGQHK